MTAGWPVGVTGAGAGSPVEGVDHCTTHKRLPEEPMTGQAFGSSLLRRNVGRSNELLMFKFQGKWLSSLDYRNHRGLRPGMR